MQYVIMAHTDIDGVAAAALYIYLTGIKPDKILFVEPYTLKRDIRKIANMDDGELILLDLGLNDDSVRVVAETLKGLVKRGVRIRWFDHHIWDPSWVDMVRSIGVELYVDSSTCTTGVVAKYVKSTSMVDRKFVNELVEGVCNGDLWRFEHWRAPWFLRLVRRRESDEWRLRVLEKLSQGIIWCKEFTENIVGKLELELLGYKAVDKRTVCRVIDGVRIAVAPSIECIDSSFVAAYVMGRFNADIVGVISSEGKLSLRSRRFCVQKIARALGGGGHRRAAGVRIEIPWRVRFLSHFIENAIETYTLNLIINTVKKLGGINALKLD